VGDGTVTKTVESAARPVLSFHKVTKAFGPTIAVNAVDFELARGEIHALVGENGAGKSTLIRILAGDYQPDAGEIQLDGRPVSFSHPSDALGNGVGFVHQIPMFVPNLSVTENLFLGAPFKRLRSGLIDWRAQHRAAAIDLAGVGLDIDPHASIETLRPHGRQLVAVARALQRAPRILVLDEVTASLSEPEVLLLHGQIRRLRDRGVAIIYVSHRLEEIFRLADRVTVMRDGRRITTLPVAGLTQRDVARLIVGSDVGHIFERRGNTAAPDHEPARLSVRGLRDEKLRGISFDLRPGEIVGLSGLAGSGRTRLLHILYGIKPFAAGEIRIDGKLVVFRDAADALAAGLAMVTEDRMDDGFVQTMPIWQNVTLPWLHRFGRLGMLQPRRERIVADANARQLDVKMPGVGALMTQLSGGNQQKVIFSRWITGPVRMLLLDEPTHGVDIRSKGQIYDIIRKLAADGVAIMIASSELEELAALSHRVLVLRRGGLGEELGAADISKAAILHALFSDSSQERVLQ
jgi:ABC-type sugar transport system ATPase subunit